MNNQSTNATSENGIRPGVLLAVIGALALISLLLWLNLSADKSAGTSLKSVATVTEAIAESSSLDPGPSYQNELLSQGPVSSKAPPSQTEVSAPVKVPSSALEKSAGLEAFSVTLVRNNLALDVRYRITKSDKVRALAEQALQAYLVDKASGERVPLAPPAQNAKIHPQQRARSAMMMNQITGFPPSAERFIVDGRAYSVLIPNQKDVFKRGARVVLELGSLESALLVVQ
jgi:hypothetical protein